MEYWVRIFKLFRNAPAGLCSGWSQKRTSNCTRQPAITSSSIALQGKYTTYMLYHDAGWVSMKQVCRVYWHTALALTLRSTGEDEGAARQ